MRLTERQAEMLSELVHSPDGRAVFPHSPHSQDKRTAYSLQRKGLCTVRILTKLPGARYSYGYRAIELIRSCRTPPYQPAQRDWHPDDIHSDGAP